MNYDEDEKLETYSKLLHSLDQTTGVNLKKSTSEHIFCLRIYPYELNEGSVLRLFKSLDDAVNCEKSLSKFNFIVHHELVLKLDVQFTTTQLFCPSKFLTPCKSDFLKRPWYKIEIEKLRNCLRRLVYTKTCNCHYHSTEPIVGIKKTDYATAFNEAFHCRRNARCSIHCYMCDTAEYLVLRHSLKIALETGQLPPIIDSVPTLKTSCLETIRENRDCLLIAECLPDGDFYKKLIFGGGTSC